MKRLIDILGAEIKTHDDITKLAEQVLSKQRDEKQVAISFILEEWVRLVEAEHKVETWYSIVHGVRCAKCGGIILKAVGPFSKPTCGGNPVVGCPKCSTIYASMMASRADIVFWGK